MLNIVVKMIGPVQTLFIVIFALFCVLVGGIGTVVNLGKYEYQMSIGCFFVLSIGLLIFHKLTHGGL